MKIEMSEELLNYLQTQNITYFADGTELYSVPGIIVKEVNGDYYHYINELDYICELKSKNKK